MRPIPDEVLDKQRREDAKKRRPLIEQWPVAIPVGYVASEDAVLYLRQRFGRALTSEKIEAFQIGQSGPRPVMEGKVAAYAFDELDLWVYRTLTGVPADWRETRGIKSTVPVTMVEDLSEVDDLPLLNGVKWRERRTDEQDDNHEEPSNGRPRQQEDGRNG